jgi:adenosine deaminase CECR1
MAHEFYQIMVGAPSISLYSWKQLARWSIDYSCLDPEDQLKAHRILARDWKTFYEYIIETYSPIMDGDEVDEVKAKETYRKCDQEQS